MLENGTGSIIQCGRKISDQEIEQIKETVDLCWRLSRYELAQTIAENLGWYTASRSGVGVGPKAPIKTGKG